MANHSVYEELYQAYVAAYDGLSQCGAFDKLASIQSR
jgi:hypothetical protein